MALTTIDDRGLKTPIDLLDNEKIRFGTGNDLEVFHDGSNSYVSQVTAGQNLFLKGDAVQIRSASNEQIIETAAHGAVKLYYDNSKKLETKSYGVNMPDNSQLYFGNGDDLLITHDGSNSKIKNSTGEMQIFGNVTRLLSNSPEEEMLRSTVNGSVDLYYDAVKKFETNADGIEIYGNCLMDADNRKVILGASDDLQIYHDGTDSIIKAAGTATPIKIQGHSSNASTVHISARADKETIKCLNNSNAPYVELFYDNSKKFETTSSGVDITGGSINTVKITGTGSHELYSYGDSGGVGWCTGAGAGNYGELLYFDEGNSRALLYVAGELGLRVVGNGAAELYYDNSKKLETTSGGAQIEGNLILNGYIDMGAGSIYTDDNGKVRLGTNSDLQIFHNGINSYLSNGTGNTFIQGGGGTIYLQAVGDENAVKIYPNAQVELYYDGNKKFHTYSEGCKVTGYIKAADNTSDSHWSDNAHNWHGFHNSLNDTAIAIFENSADSTPYGIEIYFTDVQPDNNTQFFIYASDTVNAKFRVYSDGDVWTSDAGTLSSDETLKENIVDATPKLEDLKKLKVRNFNWKSSFHPEKSKKKQLGFIAQEVEEVFPALITEHDVAGGSPNDSDHTPVMKKAIKQAWDPIIIKAMQELITKVETLETEVAALKAK